MIHHILHTVVRLLASFTAIALIATAPACTTIPQGQDRSYAGTVLSSASPAHGHASPGAVAEPDVSLAESFVEGSQTNRDGTVRIGYREVTLVMNPYLDLLAISDAAGALQDFATQYAALHLATMLAPTGERTACWQRYAGLFEALPPAGAAALADALNQDIDLAETTGGGLSVESSVAERARMSRAAKEFLEAQRGYDAGQGYVDDDEEMIMQARIHAHAAGAIASHASDTMFDLQVRRLLAATRGDLWESQAMDADKTFSGGREEWRRTLASARQRAKNAKRLYDQGVPPTVPPVALQ